MIKTIPLNKLVPSARNVRRASDEQADLELKADIEARGLLESDRGFARSRRSKLSTA
jgi:ParB family chromosome partitioning protein